MRIFIDQFSTIKVYTNQLIKIVKHQAKIQFLRAPRKKSIKMSKQSIKIFWQRVNRKTTG